MKRFNLEDAISAETCVLLQKPNELDDQQLYISFRLPQGITSTGISVLSEARHVEVYNYNNEYITTIRSFLIEDNDDELKVYQSDAAFDPPMNEFKLKVFLYFYSKLSSAISFFNTRFDEYLNQF